MSELDKLLDWFEPTPEAFKDARAELAALRAENEKRRVIHEAAVLWRRDPSAQNSGHLIDAVDREPDWIADDVRSESVKALRAEIHALRAENDAMRRELRVLREESDHRLKAYNEEALSHVETLRQLDEADAANALGRHGLAAMSQRVADLEMMLRNRDAMWCDALLPEETRTIERVTKRYNEARDKLAGK
jgi:hypothetical protein